MAETKEARITGDELNFIRHALGLSYKKIGYRNHYAAGGSDVAIGRALVERGMAIEGRTSEAYPGIVFFYITQSGFDAARKSGETMDQEEAARMQRMETSTDGR